MLHIIKTLKCNVVKHRNIRYMLRCAIPLDGISIGYADRTENETSRVLFQVLFVSSSLDSKRSVNGHVIGLFFFAQKVFIAL